MSTRHGPQVEIQRGAWQDRLREIDGEARAALSRPDRPGDTLRWALVVEPGDVGGRLAALVKPLLGDDVLTLLGGEAPVKLSPLLPRLLEAHAKEPLLGVAVCGTGDRDDARRAGFQLGDLAGRPWLFAHALEPASGLVTLIGEKTVRYLDVIEGLAYGEGPKPARR